MLYINMCVCIYIYMYTCVYHASSAYIYTHIYNTYNIYIYICKFTNSQTRPSSEWR